MRRLGSNYVLDERIGRGAQGEVWRGRSSSDSREREPESRTQEVPLAFKILRADLVDDEGLIDRFVKERATLTRIRSPYVVGIRDFVIEGTTFAIVMDYVPGGDLRGRLASDGPLAPAEVARIGMGVAEGLAAVHAANVVHRDVKPANILLDSSTDPVTPRVADFGIARIHNAVGTNHITGILGTPLYMAPEVLSGDVPGPAADIYSLGIVLYESCCGVTPFVGDPGQLLGQHINRAPGRPDGIPDSLWRILSALLAKQPAQRPSAEWVARELGSLQSSLTGIPPARRIDSPPESSPSAESYPYGRGAGSQAMASTPMSASGYAPPFQGSSADISASANSVPRGLPGYSGPYPPSYTAEVASAQHPHPKTTVYPSRPRRRFRWRIAVAATVVIALVGAGAFAIRHFLLASPASSPRSIAALPAGKKLEEQWRISNVYSAYVSPKGDMVVAGDSNKMSAYKIEGKNKSKVLAWSKECDGTRSGFWNDSQFLCDSGDKRELVSADGSTSPPPGPSEAKLRGRTSDYAILTASYSGDLLALDKNGREVWRLYGEYSDESIVTEKFILAVDDNSKTVQVISTSTGRKLASAPFVKPYESLKENPHPAGFGIDVGENAFYQIKDGKYTIWDVEGKKKESGESGMRSDNWMVSTNVKPEELAETFKKIPDKYGNVVRGKKKMVVVRINNSRCKIKIDNKVMSVPAPETGSSCAISIYGLIGDDNAILLGSNSDSEESILYDKGGVVAAYSLKDGSMLWKSSGKFKYVLDDRHILITEGDYWEDIIVGEVKD